MKETVWLARALAALELFCCSKSNSPGYRIALAAARKLLREVKRYDEDKDA